VQPTILDVDFNGSSNEACTTVRGPKRMMHHLSGSKFELQWYKYVVVTGNDEVIELDEIMTAAFSDDIVNHTIKIPPQVCSTTGNLKVGAVYGDGRVEYSAPSVAFELPHYGKMSGRMLQPRKGVCVCVRPQSSKCLYRDFGGGVDPFQPCNQRLVKCPSLFTACILRIFHLCDIMSWKERGATACICMRYQSFVLESLMWI
jgi:hypothetical protein